jgi:predicted aspartyl protease
MRGWFISGSMLTCWSALAWSAGFVIAATLAEQHRATLDMGVLPMSGLFTVTAKLDNGETPTFILDTGSRGCYISQELSRRLSLKAEQVKDASGQTVKLPLNDNRPAERVYLKRLILGKFAPTDVPMYVVPRAKLEGLVNAPVDGVIGMSILENFAVEIDVIGRKLTLHYPGTLTGEQLKSAGFADPSGVPLEIEKSDVYVTLQVNGLIEERCQLDLGSQRTIISSGTARALRLERTETIFQLTARGATPTDIVKCNSLRVGGNTINNVVIGALTGSSKKDETPLLGLDFLSKFHMLIDLPGKRLYLDKSNAK